MLKTPVQFEPAFDRLNEVRPLKLADRVKINLDLPVCNVNPTGTSRRAIGKLLRCNNVGSMLKNHGDGFETTLYRDCLLLDTNSTDHVDFTPPVKGVLVKWTGGTGPTTVHWVAGYTHFFEVEIFRTPWLWLPFTGSRIWFYGHRFVGTWVRVEVYGFW